MVSDLSNCVAKVKVSVLKSTPRKLGLVVGLIRGKPVADALLILKYCRKKVASLVSKALNSAISNAQNNVGVDVDGLYVSEVLVGKSMTLRRVQAKAMGRACRISKRYSNLTIKLSEQEE